MKRLEDLPEIASRQLGGLEATPTILTKAKLRVSQANSPRVAKRYRWQPVLCACMALVLCVGAALWVTDGGDSTVVPRPTENVLDSHSAGDEATPTTQPRKAADVPVGSISMGAGEKSAAETLFAQAQGNSFPLITVNGATYRMLRSPNGISSSLLGDELGAVTEFNVEPALGSGGVVSNVVSRGEKVYAISGLGGALVSASVEGSLRVFQRVSYAGTAIIGSETLGDTLCSASDVKWLEISGVGLVDDVDDAQALMQTLLDGADYQSTSMTGSGSLQIGLTNGLTLQLLVGDDTVSACGAWSCPDFFDGFHEAVGK